MPASAAGAGAGAINAWQSTCQPVLGLGRSGTSVIPGVAMSTRISADGAGGASDVANGASVGQDTGMAPPPYVLVSDPADLPMVAAAVEQTALVGLDTETTGLNPVRDQIIELAILEGPLTGGVPQLWRFKPTVPVSPAAFGIHRHPGRAPERLAATSTARNRCQGPRPPHPLAEGGGRRADSPVIHDRLQVLPVINAR